MCVFRCQIRHPFLDLNFLSVFPSFRLSFIESFSLLVFSVMSSSKPTLIFVHGAWHGPEVWDKIVPLLEAQQYACVRVKLPSTRPGPPTPLIDDIELVRNAILAETSQAKNVVLIVHSFGGSVGASALKGLARLKSQSAELKGKGHVIGMIMLASFFQTTGSSFAGHLGGLRPDAFWVPLGDYAHITRPFAPLFYNDLSPEEGQYWAEKVGTHSLAAFMEGDEHMYAGWMDVPVWYLVTKDDKCIALEGQRAFIKRAQGEGADVQSREIEGSHSPMLSRPQETVEFIGEALAAFTKT